MTTTHTSGAADLPEATASLIERLEDAVYEWGNYVDADHAPCPLTRHVDPHIKSIRAELERLHALAAGQAVAPAEPDPTPADHPPPCDSELFENGVSVGLFDIPKWTAEALCKGIAAATGARVDWHYIGGRVHVKARPAPPAMDGAWKDHNTAQLVNELRDIAVEFHGAQQLRARIAHVIVPLTDKLKAAMDGGEDAERWRAWAGAMVEACNAPGLNPDFILALSTAVGEAESPITLEQLNAWTDAARAAKKGGE